LQGTLLFLGLLILLWVPLIAFSSGNPTYQASDPFLNDDPTKPSQSELV
jgi:hypothetical protein